MILTILKIIGIVILIILLLIILLLSFILLIPIRYRFSAEYFEKPDVFATVKYALVGLNAQVTFKDNDLQYTVKALRSVMIISYQQVLQSLLIITVMTESILQRLISQKLNLQEAKMKMKMIYL